MLDEALALTNWVLDRPEARELVDALLAALRSERFLQGAGAFGARWVERDEVRAAVGAALNGAALKVLEDAQVRDIAQIFVKSLLEQPHLQAKTSEHIWGAIKGVFIGPPRAAPRPSRPPPAASRRKPRRWRRRPSRRRRRRWPWRPASRSPRSRRRRAAAPTSRRSRRRRRRRRSRPPERAAAAEGRGGGAGRRRRNRPRPSPRPPPAHPKSTPG